MIRVSQVHNLMLYSTINKNVTNVKAKTENKKFDRSMFRKKLYFVL